MKSLLLIPAFVLASCIIPSTHLAAQTLTWTAPVSDLNVAMNGISEREAPAAAVYDGKMYMAYTSEYSTGDADNDYYVYFGSNTGGSTGYEPLNYINPSGGIAATNLNPSLLAFGPYLYLALADNNPVNNFPPSYTALNGTTGQWGDVTGFPTTAANSGSSVGMATDGTYLYMGYRNINDNTLVLCRMNASQVITCTNFPGTTTMGFSPSLLYSGGSLYIAFQNLGDHNLDYYVSTDQGQTIGNVITTANSDQTSTTPSLVQYGSYIYMGFRTNDGDHKFIYKATSNGGASWDASTEHTGAGYAMGGNPVLVNGAGLTNYAGYLYNIYAGNSSPFYVYTSFVTAP